MDDLSYVDYSVQDIFTIIHVFYIDTRTRVHVHLPSLTYLTILIDILLTLVDDTYIQMYT